MAGDWVKMRVDLDEDPAVIGMASVLGIPADHIIGKLWKIWRWSNRQTIDGKVFGIHDDWIDGYLECPGFAKAMRLVGWLELNDSGFSIPRFDRHNSDSAKRRALRSLRESRNRCTRNVTGDDAKAPPEKRREEKNLFSAFADGEEPSTASERLDIRDGSTNPDQVARPADRHPPAIGLDIRDGSTSIDALFDAVASVTGSDATTSAAHLGRVCKCLREANPPYTASEVTSLSRILADRGFTLPLTPGTVLKYIGWTRIVPSEEAAKLAAGAERERCIKAQRESAEQAKRKAIGEGKLRGLEAANGKERNGRAPHPG